MLESQVSRYLSLLQRQGWSHHEISGGKPWWIAQYKTPRRLLEVQIAACGDLLVLQTAITVQPSVGCRPALYAYLLRLNNELRIAKLSLDREGRVWLSAEIPLVASGIEELLGILDGLRTYFEHYHREVELIASDRFLAETWLSVNQLPDDLLDVTVVQ